MNIFKINYKQKQTQTKTNGKTKLFLFERLIMKCHFGVGVAKELENKGLCADVALYIEDIVRTSSFNDFKSELLITSYKITIFPWKFLVILQNKKEFSSIFNQNVNKMKMSEFNKNIYLYQLKYFEKYCSSAKSIYIKRIRQ